MDRQTAVPLRIGAWRVDPATAQISRDGESLRLEARTLRLLLCLAQRAGDVVSIDDLLAEVWSGVIVTPDSVYQAVASLRRVLGDDPKQPTYIATVPRLGYRMIASVGLWADVAEAGRRDPTVGVAGDPAGGPTMDMVGDPAREADGAPRKRWRPATLLATIAIACVALAVTVAFRGNTNALHPASATIPARSVAVLPFLDLTTQEMNEEYFADGMTEELIDRLSKIPGLRVPGATSSFYFKGKHMQVADIARSLGVLYVLDGSIRKSGDTLRVAARLVRAGDGYVIWSETYDRPLDNKLKIQDEIAGKVAGALTASID